MIQFRYRKQTILVSNCRGGSGYRVVEPTLPAYLTNIPSFRFTRVPGEDWRFSERKGRKRRPNRLKTRNSRPTTILQLIRTLYTARCVRFVAPPDQHCVWKVKDRKLFKTVFLFRHINERLNQLKKTLQTIWPISPDYNHRLSITVIIILQYSIIC